MKTFIIFIPLFFFISFLSFSQMTNSSLPEIIPRSPNAAALEKFGSYPVSYNNGTVGISVDLYQLNLDRNIDLNISLNYHSSGIKVEDVSSWVGTGWALSAGGCITREVRGIRDEDHAGFYNYSLRNPGHTLPENINDKTHAKTLSSINAGAIDSQPDIFSYNFNGRSGKFFVDNYGEFQTVPQADIKFNKHPLSTIASGYSSWELVDENGCKYVFSFIETTQVNGDDYVTAWWLTSIVSPEEKTLLTIEYKNDKFAPPSLTRKSYTFDFLSFLNYNVEGDYLLGEKSFDTSINFSGANISKIIMPGKGNIVFKASTESNDQRWLLLDALEYLDINNNLKYKYLLEYEHERDRPYLKKIKKASLAEEVVFRTFIYNPGLPPRNSKSQDLWGYFNGKNNTSLYPLVQELYQVWGLGYTSGDRFPTEKAIAGTIKEINYPTGGKTVFKFENNAIYGEDEFYETERKWFYHSHYGYGEETSTFRTLDYVIEDLHVRMALHTVGIYNSEISLVNVETNKRIVGWKASELLDLYGPPTVSDDGNVQYDFVAHKIKLEAGSYKWESKIINNDPGYDNLVPAPVTISHSYIYPKKMSETKEKRVGGLRISEITNYNNDNEIVNQTRYKYLTPGGICSGVGAPDPVFVREYCVNLCIKNSEVLGVTLNLLELNEVDLNNYSGSAVQYKYVTEEKLEEGICKLRTDYEYQERFFSNKVISSYSVLDCTWKETPYSMNDYEEGRLLSKSDYKYDNGKYILLKKENYEWVINDYSVPKVRALSVLPVYKIYQCYISSYDPYNLGFYDITAAKVYLAKKEVKETTDSGEMLTAVTYRYDNPDYMQLTKTIITDSQGKTIETSNKYCFDESTTINDKMKAKNMVAQPLEITKTVSGSQTEKLKVTYETFNDEAILEPKHIEKQTTSDAGFSGVTYHQYDSYGNPLHLSQNNAIEVFYLWSYNGKYPIAEIRNATYAKVEAAAKTVFGVKSINELSALASVDTGKVRSLSNDKNLVDSHVTVYTYDSTGNMLTATDPSGVTTFYVYDSFDRLMETYIKENGIKKPLSTYKYKYKN